MRGAPVAGAGTNAHNPARTAPNAPPCPPCAPPATLGRGPPRTAGEAAACPVCLDRPRLPRITRCGHVFCLPCIFRCAEGGRCRCPICFRPAELADLRPVEQRPSAVPGAAGAAAFRLLGRHRSSIVPRVASARAPPEDGPAGGEPRGDAPEPLAASGTADGAFNRVCAADKRGFRMRLWSERAALLALYREAVSEGDLGAAASLAELRQWHDSLMARHGCEENAERDLAGDDGAADAADAGAAWAPPATPEEAWSAAAADVTADAPGGQDAPPGGPAGGAPVFFYQLSSGDAAFLHPLCMRMLRAEAEARGCGLPLGLPALRVVEAERLRLSPDAKRRYAFLSHLPRGADVTFLEVDLGALVGEEVLRRFAPDLKKRERRRSKASSDAARERREERRLEGAARRREKDRLRRIRATGPSPAEAARAAEGAAGPAEGAAGAPAGDGGAAEDAGDAPPLGQAAEDAAAPAPAPRPAAGAWSRVARREPDLAAFPSLSDSLGGGAAAAPAPATSPARKGRAGAAGTAEEEAAGGGGDADPWPKQPRTGGQGAQQPSGRRKKKGGSRGQPLFSNTAQRAYS